jgi:cytochrome c oxidase subunit II
MDLFVLLIRDFLVGNKIYALSDSDALAIKLVGHQWWWEAQYSDPEPSRIVTTANELHIPVGKVVKFELQSTDVIHSLWVPNLHGKRDLVPGHPTTVLLRADREGEYHGQCAEFCGYQHAHMRILIVADEPPKFEKWLDTQRQDARSPATPIAKSGRDVFLTSQCVMCHNIAGTDARATLGPDLSHIGSHKTLAAGSFTNTPEVLAKWISDPQKMKPGVLMPPNELSADALNALVAYLESLK